MERIEWWSDRTIYAHSKRQIFEAFQGSMNGKYTSNHFHMCSGRGWVELNTGGGGSSDKTKPSFSKFYSYLYNIRRDTIEISTKTTLD